MKSHSKKKSEEEKRPRRQGIWNGQLTVGACFAAGGFFLRAGAHHISGFADAYRNLTNAFWVNTLGRLSGILPCSLAELLIYAAVILVVMFFVRLLIRLIRRKKGIGKMFLKAVRTVALLSGIIFFLYESGEDLPFYGTTFSTTYGYADETYSTEELEETAMMLAQKVNVDAERVARDSRGIMKNGKNLGERVRRNMFLTGRQYPVLSGWYPRPKPVLLSKLMSYTNLTGIYTAWTEEANYNRDIPDYNIAFTMSHELSHLKGILPENEANFAAYLSCVDSPETDIRYSGELMAYIYCINELYKRDAKRWQAVAGTLCQKANDDLEDNNAYWKKFRGRTSKASEKLNDAYLKQAGQSAGVESYNQVVALIVDYTRKTVTGT